MSSLFFVVLDKLGHCVDFEEEISNFCIFLLHPFLHILYIITCLFIKDMCEYIYVTMQHIKLGLIG